MGKMKILDMNVVETVTTTKTKDGEDKTTFSVKLESGDGITVVVKSNTEIDLKDGETGIIVTIENPQTRLDGKK